MPRILHLVEYLVEGGIERLLENLARYTPPSNALLSILSYETAELSGIGDDIRKLGIPLYTHKKQKGFDRELLHLIVEIVKEKKTDVIHTHDFGPMLYAILLKIRFPSLGLVHTQHTLHNFLPHRRYVAFFQLASLFYKQIICVSGGVLKSLESACRFGCPRLVTIPNGVPTSHYCYSPSKISRGSTLRLVSISRISPEKNLLHTLQACAALKSNGIQFEFHHAGSGNKDETKRILSFISSKALQAHVFFHGFQRDVREVLALGDIFVSSSRTEGHPVAVLEAMATGKICLCSDIEAHRTLSPNLLFFSLNDDSLFQRLMEIHCHPELFLDRSEKVRSDVEDHYSIQRMIAAYSQTYENFGAT